MNKLINALQGDLEGLGPQAAHAGVLAAAVAIAADLARHRILDLLLCGPNAVPPARSGSRVGGPGLGGNVSGGCGGPGDGSEGGARGCGGDAAPPARSGSRVGGLGLDGSAASPGGGSERGAHEGNGPAGGEGRSECAPAAAQRLRKTESWLCSVACIRRRRLECRVRLAARPPCLLAPYLSPMPCA